MWNDLGRAVALMLVIEGLMPFVSPRRFRRSLLNFAAMEDRSMRLLALASMAAGLIVLHFLTR